MMNDSAFPELPELPEQPVAPPPPPPPERVPFWGYHDLFIFIIMFLISLTAGFATVNGFLKLFHISVHRDLFRLLPAQFLAYLFLFVGVSLLFRAQYGRPFWLSLGWTNLLLRPGAIVSYGVLLAFAVVMAARVLQTPDVPTPMSKMLSD